MGTRAGKQVDTFRVGEDRTPAWRHRLQFREPARKLRWPWERIFLKHAPQFDYLFVLTVSALHPRPLCTRAVAPANEHPSLVVAPITIRQWHALVAVTVMAGPVRCGS